VNDKPFLTTERLELWMPRTEDMRAMHEVVLDPQTSRFLGPRAQFSDHATRFMRNAGSWQLYGYGALMLRLRGQERVIGNCGVFHTFRGLGDDFDDHPEAGWIVAADQVGQGLAREAMETVLDWFDREHGRHRIVCMISSGNHASLNLAAKLGFAEYRHAELADDPMQLLERIPV
jgi:RimJ/RimL family protein N-acetyltransferase